LGIYRVANTRRRCLAWNDKERIMPNRILTRYPNQFWEPTPIDLVEASLGLRRQSRPTAEPRAAMSSPASTRWRFRSRPRAIRLNGSPAHRAA
jgi:hypothetical protein